MIVSLRFVWGRKEGLVLDFFMFKKSSLFVCFIEIVRRFSVWRRESREGWE